MISLKKKWYHENAIIFGQKYGIKWCYQEADIFSKLSKISHEVKKLLSLKTDNKNYGSRAAYDESQKGMVGYVCRY